MATSRGGWPSGPGAPLPSSLTAAQTSPIPPRPGAKVLSDEEGAARAESLRQKILSGSDFAAGDMFAVQMRNFAYLIGDRQTGDCMVVDPAYAAGDLLDTLETAH